MPVSHPWTQFETLGLCFVLLLLARPKQSLPRTFVRLREMIALRRLGISRQAVWQRVKRGELEALHVRKGQRKGCARATVRSTCAQRSIMWP